MNERFTQQDERLSEIIGDIYDAALNPGLWGAAFDKVCEFVGGAIAFVLSQDNVRKLVRFYFASDHDPQYRQLYVDKYFRINPIFPTVQFFDVEDARGMPDIVPYDEFCRTQFSREFIAPQGYVDAMFSNVEKSATGCAVFSVMRHSRQGLVDDEMKRRFAILVPHIRRALLIGNVIDLHKVEAAMLADSLDALAAGMLIVDANGRIAHANLSAHAMISEGNVLRAPAGRLGATDLQADQALLDVFTAAGAGDATLGRRGIAVPLTARDGARYVAHVLPLTSGARRKAGSIYRAAAVAFVHKASIDGPSPPEAIVQQFRLTAAELRVLFAIVEMGGVPDVANILGLSEPTVKAHLRHIFAKTESRRQADLVKLVASYSSPLLAKQ